MPDAREIYQLHVEEYAALVRCEDREGNLLKAIRDVVTLEGLEVVELGAGTGRVTALLAPHVRSIRAFDIAPAMLEMARRTLEELGTRNWQLGMADNARLPAGREVRQRGSSVVEVTDAEVSIRATVPLLPVSIL